MPDESPAPPKLTRCQLDVLRELTTGASDRTIADKLFLSHRTVQWHMNNLRKRFDVPNRTMLLLCVQRAGLL